MNFVPETMPYVAGSGRAPDGLVPSCAIDGHTDRGGMYVTDGVFLYRVAGRVRSDAGEMVELEDCYGLDVVTASEEDLRARRLRVVTPTSIGSLRAVPNAANPA
jgi:hypothetical protein